MFLLHKETFLFWLDIQKPTITQIFPHHAILRLENNKHSDIFFSSLPDSVKITAWNLFHSWNMIYAFQMLAQETRFKLFPSYDFLPSVKRNQMWEKYCRKATKCKIYQQPFVLQNFGNKNSLKRIKMWNNKKAFLVFPLEKEERMKERKGKNICQMTHKS